MNSEKIERFRTVLMLKLHRRGIPQRAIGQIFGLTQQAVSYRINRSMPREAREYYESLPLGELEEAGVN